MILRGLTMHHAAPEHRTVRLSLGERAYEVRIGNGLLDDLGTLAAEALGRPLRRVFMVVDSNVETHAARATASLASVGGSSVSESITAAEARKSVETVHAILTRMAEARLERDDPVVALGGGIACDVAGFAAACYRRGVPIIQCPTTLLAMVDASVGGKTGVNLRAGGALQKNMAGAFHQPSLVLADIGTLATLPDREFRAGLAECVKHGLLSGCVGDVEHLDWIARSIDAVLARDAPALIELIARSVAFKAAIVTGDERETGDGAGGRPSRALLNLGHTFAHAIETLPGLRATGSGAEGLLHGEAVALGLVAAARSSAAMGLAGPDLEEEVRSLLARCGLPAAVRGLVETQELLGRMGADKKAAAGRLRLILPLPGRTARIVVDPAAQAVAAGWDAIRDG